MKHLAVIADGNRRWAVKNGLPKGAGHAQGLIGIERVSSWALERNIPFVTVFCLSTENFGRPASEIENLFGLARHYFGNVDFYIGNGINVRFSGRRDRFAEDVQELMAVVEAKTKGCKRLYLTICVDYGGRDEIARAVQNGARTETEITEALMGDKPAPDVILRTGGFHRLSNFLLWQSAYSEIYFTDTLFPDIDPDELDDVLQWFYTQKRNFGK